MTLEEMKQVDLKTVNPDDLVDITDVKIDKELPKEERLRQYIEQVKNPYCFRVGKIVVKLCFAENGPTLEERLQNMMLRM